MIQPGAFFDSLSDSIRRRILALIHGQDELCVCELVAALDLPQPKISRHLAVLRAAGILSIRREGTWVYYRLDAGLPLWAYRILEIASRDAAETESANDQRRLADTQTKQEQCSA